MLEKGKEPFLLQENGYCGGPSSSDALHNLYGWKKYYSFLGNKISVPTSSWDFEISIATMKTPLPGRMLHYFSLPSHFLPADIRILLLLF